MYFYLDNGKQHLDLKGDLILTHNEKLIKTRVKSAAPVSAKNAQYITVKKLSLTQKLRATFSVIGFIWGSDQSLKREDTAYRESHRASVANSVQRPEPPAEPPRKRNPL